MKETRPSFLKLALPAVAILVALGVVTALIAGGAGGKTKLPGNVKRAAPAGGYQGAVATPAQAAPPLELRDSTGAPVNLADYRGKAALVTFLYTHCPDVCPLITANLHTAVSRLGPKASEVQILAVSVDPRGDTRKSVAAFLKAHLMTGRMRYLLGSADQLARVWMAWNVGSKRDAGNPQLVAHSALVYGITGSGKIQTLYPANFKPAMVVHDVPLLAAH